MFTKFKKCFFVGLVSLLSFAFAELTSITGLYRYKLDNGLELFVAENDAAPLAYIEIAVRAGAVTQTPSTAGLFHLYEHMMFKGNDRYANQDEFTMASNMLGQTDQNGSTGVDRVNYYFTIPASKVRDGLEFWSYAIRTPKIDMQELENEKAVVLAEINADFTDPAHIRTAALFKTMFPDGAWRVDPAGSPAAVESASVDSLRDIQKKYYVPSNSAIFVGGNVNHDDVYNYVKEIYGDWQNPVAKTSFELPGAKNPLPHDKKLVFVNPGNSDSMIQVGYYLRGPDGETDAADTYAADVWLTIANNPKGLFATTFTSARELGIPESDYVGVSYPTRRASALIGFSAAMMNNPSQKVDTNYGFGTFRTFRKDNMNPAEKADAFLSLLKEKAIPSMSDRELFFKDNAIASVLQQLADSRIYELESAKSILASLSYFWSTCGSDYFFSYDQNIARTTEEDVLSFVQNYLENRSGTLIVSVSPGVWAQYKSAFENHGYEQITEENAFWQKDFVAQNDAK
ncbi:MAG: insulinase family protein [Treponema sp.]|nr:insulinase family protein [Treponema sp.]